MIIKGVVIHGAELGRRLGFPTANLDATNIDIANGVYLSRVSFGGRSYKAMTNIGCRPSVDGESRLLEAHIFDYEGDLYEKQIEVELLSKLRDEQRFDSISELQEQLKRDAERCYSMEW
ncbi:MAG: riboflavin kinase [Alistipes sp.]|jgi:riboflavin kinase/FMN adenylyltransferase|nr:riboflavin kinase [Alistipes sp.]MBQ5622989.1 riboflavin kinase [Alistipes sp.]MBQ5913740.1 riboflavin kinase [Alistipes sp.]MBR5802060.1 riboflavin kinase [Alistipes sp.]MEE1103109.1 riboflavin kinase [Alistipes sp.]